MGVDARSSRKLAELGYKRSAKKCREKFENVQKYYKRTREDRAGRQDGKSYKFFSQLEALHTNTCATADAIVLTSVPPVTAASAAILDVAPISVGIPVPISSVRMPLSSHMLPMPGSSPAPMPVSASVSASAPLITSAADPFGISTSSNSSSFSGEIEDDDDEEDELGGEPSNMDETSRKRRRQSARGGGDTTTKRMMEFFGGIMKQVLQKQEAMQKMFLEAIKKREQDRMIREEAWKRQEMARLTREHELMAQECAIAASKDAAIISFLQKITGQSIELPTTVSVPAAPLPGTQLAVSVVPASAPPVHPPSPSIPQQQQQSQSHQQHQQQQHQRRPMSSEVVMAVPEQKVPPPHEIGGSGNLEPASSSRWPKAEVLALINLRAGLETTYQEDGPKGPLWEEISAGMFRIGYKRSAKRCKEKWENINKYFKKLKESTKKRPEDAKTCPYFHQLDDLCRKKILGGGTSGGSSSFNDRNRPEEETSQRQQLDTSDGAAPQITAVAPPLTQPTDQFETKTGATADVLITSKEGLTRSLFGEGNGGASKKPEVIVRELMEEQRMHHQQQHYHQRESLSVDGYDKIDEPYSDNTDHEEDEDDDELEEDQKMGFKIAFQRQNESTHHGGGNGAPTFLAIVQ